ncbi:HNH endonuclease signature motif containing protein [Microbacterium sp. EF45047]|uniref:HNH endonuclease signature motif containing protein n=1 Tax=Microbacterium sp. EF45047 TaxID=2809708 RepID=UPI00234A3F77|nr:HNH endonuclease signature motif containing protein [Microbacterium sp. EF45047]WCM54689.1 HNH endonuclease [Microbacterium sp. EF45047]
MPPLSRSVPRSWRAAVDASPEETDAEAAAFEAVDRAAADARAAHRRLTATAKHMQKSERDGRTRDQIRADLFASWQKGEGTLTAVKTCVYVTIPMQLLAGEPVPMESARFVGGDTIDPVTDRRTYRPTKAQRDFLILQHGTCARDGCERLAAEADIDHERPWATGGRTNVADLRPLCPRDHTHRHRTKARFRSRPDRTVQVIMPTGKESSAPREARTGPIPWTDPAARPLRPLRQTHRRRSDRYRRATSSRTASA